MSSKEEALQKLLSWALSNGAIVDQRIRFRYTEESGISAFYKTPSSPTTVPATDKLIIKIPEKLIITPDNAYVHFNVTDRSQIGHVTLVKFYLCALRATKDGFYQPYLRLLPGLREIGSPLTYSPDELLLLKGTNIFNGVELKLKSLLDEFTDNLQVIGRSCSKDYKNMNSSQLYRTIITETRSSSSEFTFGWFVWAHLIITSRAFPYKLVSSTSASSSIMLLPVVDLLNHSSGSKVSWFGSPETFELQIDGSNGLDEGNQIFNNYGPKGNEELFMGYGFTIEGNQHEILNLSLNVGSIVPLIKVQMNEPSNEWGIKLPKLEDYTYSISESLNDDEPEVEEVDEKGDQSTVIYLCNRNHLLPDGLLELYAFMAKNPKDNRMSLKSELNGLNNLRTALDLKFKGKLDHLDGLSTEVMDQYRLNDPDFEVTYTSNYNNIKIYKKSQIGILNQVKKQIKLEEKTILKGHRKRLLTIKDIITKDEEQFGPFIKIFQLDKDAKDLDKFEMELLVHFWLLKVVNYSDSNSSSIEMDWIIDQFSQLKYKIVDPEEFPELVDIYNQTIPPLQDSMPEMLSVGNHWDLNSFLLLDQIYSMNSYEKGSSLEPILIQPTLV